MAWIEPKTDWHGSVDENGSYTGDRFNASDFNRIKNNLAFLRDMAVEIYDDFEIVPMGDDRTPENYFYADEINEMERNFSTINTFTVKCNYGAAPIYMENGPTMDFSELNRLESAMLDLYGRLKNAIEGRRMFTWHFGMKGGGL